MPEISERRIADPVEIADLVDAGKLDIRAFLRLEGVDTAAVVREFLDKGYGVSETLKDGVPVGYAYSRPFSKMSEETKKVMDMMGLVVDHLTGYKDPRHDKQTTK